MHLGQSAGTVTPETSGYLNTIFMTAAYIENQLLPQERARLAAWEAAARGAGVHEANVIAVLRSWNTWEDAVATLATVAIPNEMIRVQNGGAIGNVSQFQPTSPPALPDISGLVTAQGGARTGTDQYSGPISPIESPPVVLPPAVAPPAPNGENGGAVTVVPTGGGGSTTTSLPDDPGEGGDGVVVTQETPGNGNGASLAVAGGVVLLAWLLFFRKKR